MRFHRRVDRQPRNQSLTRRRSFRSTLEARFLRQWLPTRRSIVGECASRHSGGCAKRGMKSVIGNHFSFSARSGRVLSLLSLSFLLSYRAIDRHAACRNADPVKRSGIRSSSAFVIHYGRTHPAKRPARILFGLISSICPRRVYMRRRGGLFSEWKRVRRRSPPRLFRERCPDIPSAIHFLVCSDTQRSLPKILVCSWITRVVDLPRKSVIYPFAVSVHRTTETNLRSAPHSWADSRCVLLLRTRDLPARGFPLTLGNRSRNKCEQAWRINAKNGIDRPRGGRARASETSAIMRMPPGATSPCINTEGKFSSAAAPRASRVKQDRRVDVQGGRRKRETNWARAL